MKTTIDLFTGKPFRWNGTGILETARGPFRVPHRCTARLFVQLHPARVPMPLLAALNDGKTWLSAKAEG